MSQRAEGGVWPAELKLLQHLSGCPRTDKSVLFEEAQALWETLSDDSGLPQCTHKGFKNHSPLFQWKQLENLYFREKKFAVEVNDPHRRVESKRTFGQSGLVIHSWYASHTLIKTIWVMAISQHQFYLDRKQSKAKLTTGRTLGDIAMDLTEIGAPRVSKLVSMESKDQLIMASNGSLVSTGSADFEANEEKKQEKIAELKKKEKDLQDTLSERLNELKQICLREAELTGRLPKEYPLQAGEKAPTFRKRVGTAFKLDDLFPYDKDPHLRNLESRFALQQKIVEAAKKLANEGELCKTVKKKRRSNCQDAMRKLQEIEKEINNYRIKTGKLPTQRASVIIDEGNPSDLSSLSDSLNLEDDDASIGQRQRSRSVQYMDRPSPSETLGGQFYTDRRSSTNDQLQDVNFNRLVYGEVQDSYQHAHRDVVSGHSSPYRPGARQPRDTRSMPPTPVLTRNAYSSTQLSYEDGPQHFRQRSGSLESQQTFLTEAEAREAPYLLAVPRRSTSTEILDDGSSYTSQSSVEYSAAPSYHGGGGGTNHMPRARRLHQRRAGTNIYANTGSMPNLAQHDTYRPPSRATTTTAYYVTGYPCHGDPEPYSNGAYAYENESEGHYSVNNSASYYHHQQQQQPQHHHHHYQTAYHGHEAYRGGYGTDELDSLPQHNVYATLRPPRSRPTSHNENGGKNLHKAIVAEHLRGWYNRNTGQKQQHGAFDYDRGSQHSLGYQTMSSTYGHGHRNASYSSVSSATSDRNWRGHHLSPGLDDYAHLAPQPSYGGGYSSAHYVQPAHSRPPPESVWQNSDSLWQAPRPLDMHGAVGYDPELEYYSARKRFSTAKGPTLI